jgi:hypothetical protein
MRFTASKSTEWSALLLLTVSDTAVLVRIRLSASFRRSAWLGSDGGGYSSRNLRNLT